MFFSSFFKTFPRLATSISAAEVDDRGHEMLSSRKLTEFAAWDVEKAATRGEDLIFGIDHVMKIL